MGASPDMVPMKLMRDDATLVALLSDGSNSIYPGDAPDQAEYPFITYQSRLIEPGTNLAGNHPLKGYMITVACLARTYLRTKEMETAVRSVLDGVRQTTVTIGSTTIDVRAIDEDSARDIKFKDTKGGDVGVFSTEIDYRLFANLP